MNPAPFTGFNIWIPNIIPIKGRGFINPGLGYGVGTHQDDVRLVRC